MSQLPFNNVNSNSNHGKGGQGVVSSAGKKQQFNSRQGSNKAMAKRGSVNSAAAANAAVLHPKLTSMTSHQSSQNNSHSSYFYRP